MKGKSSGSGPSGKLASGTRGLLVFYAGSPEECPSGMMISCFILLFNNYK
jgi:hypothetical protein